MTYVKTRFIALGLVALVGCGSAEKEPTQEHKAHEQPEPKTDERPAAPVDHAHDSPHGGKVATAGDKHLEVKITREGHIDVFVLDGDARPTSTKGAQGGVTLVFSEGVKEFPLSYDERSDHLTAMAPALRVSSVVVLVELTIDGRPYSARFDYELSAEVEGR